MYKLLVNLILLHFLNILLFVSANKCKETTLNETNALYENAICGTIHFNLSEVFITLKCPHNRQATQVYRITFTCVGYCPLGFLIYENKENNSALSDDNKNYYFVHETPFRWYTTDCSSVLFYFKKMKAGNSVSFQYELIEADEPNLQDDVHLCPTVADDSTVKFNGYCYTFDKNVSNENILTWREAQEKCKSTGGYLLTIHTMDELRFVKGMMRRWLVDEVTTIYLGMEIKIMDAEWVDGSPVTVTDWYRPKPYPSRVLPVEYFGHGIKFSSALMIQPSHEYFLECAAMKPLPSPLSTNWFRIPCAFPYPNSGYVCKQPAGGPTTTASPVPILPSHGRVLKTSEGKGYLVPGDKACPLGWTFVDDRCYRLLTSKESIYSNMTCAEARNVCHAANGYMAQLNTSEVLVPLLKIWLHEYVYGSIWLADCDVFIPVSGEPLNGTVYILNVLCETSTLNIIHSCGESEFQCKDMSCILSVHRCDGIHDCPSGDDEENCACAESDFRCEDGQCIPYGKYCDIRPDCLDNSDEKNCTFLPCDANQRACNDKKQCVEENKFGDLVYDCLDLSDENKKVHRAAGKDCKTFHCFSGQCFPDSFKNDLRVDCEGPQQEDEEYEHGSYRRGHWLDSKGKARISRDPYCLNAGDVRCHVDHEYCIPRHRSCIFDHDKYDRMNGCPDGAHLRNCESFQCPKMLKCPNSYCIPYHKVCDGTYNCPDGSDENFCSNYSCKGLLRCREEKICISRENVCDGIVHCKNSREDERFCSMKTCLPKCSCKAGVVYCTGIQGDDIQNITKDARFLSVNGSVIVSVAENHFLGFKFLGVLKLKGLGIQILNAGAFNGLVNLLKLDLRNNVLNVIKNMTFVGLSALQHLLLTGNSIFILETGAFYGLTSLRYLRLHGNNLSDVQDGAFLNLRSVKILSLKANNISRINRLTFQDLSRLEILDLRDNPLKHVAKNTFANRSLRLLQFDMFKFCCLAPPSHVKNCTPGPDMFSSCEDLLANQFLQGVVWLLGLSATIGNIGVVIWRVVIGDRNPYSLMVINLGIADLLMGIYLLIVAAADNVYRGNYIQHADKWRQSILCKFAGFLSTCSSEMSVFMLLMITTDRLFTLLFPFKAKLLTLRKAAVIMCVGWVAVSLLSAFPVVGISYFGEEYIKHGVCLLFNISVQKAQGWEYTTFVFLLFNLAAFIFIFSAYAVIFLSIRKTRQNAGRKVAKEDLDIARRFTLIVATDFVCWIPLIFTAFAVTGGATISQSVTAWLALFILPLNSGLNPHLYTSTALVKRLRDRTHRTTCITQT